MSEQNTSDLPPALVEDETPSNKLRVQNLHYDVSERELEVLFSQVGPLLVPPRLIFDKADRSTGVAKITFVDVHDAIKARTAFDGALAKGQPLSLSYDPDRRDPFVPGSLRTRVEPFSRDRASRGRKNRSFRSPLESKFSRDDHEARPRQRDRNSGRSGRRDRGAGKNKRNNRAPPTAADLDNELETFMKTEAKDANEATPKTRDHTSMDVDA